MDDRRAAAVAAAGASTNARPFDLVIFDLDGTLVDSVPDIAWAVNAALDEAGLPALSVEGVTALVGDGAARLIQKALHGIRPSLRPDPDLILGRFLHHYERHLSVTTRPYPGVPELLDSLTRAGVVMAVLTNKPQALARKLLGALSLADRFALIVGDSDEFPRKPDPTAARTIMARLGVAAARTAVVGDGLPDMALAHAVPCAAVAAAWGYVPKPRLLVENPAFVAQSPHQAGQFLLSASPATA